MRYVRLSRLVLGCLLTVLGLVSCKAQELQNHPEPSPTPDPAASHPLEGQWRLSDVQYTTRTDDTFAVPDTVSESAHPCADALYTVTYDRASAKLTFPELTLSCGNTPFSVVVPAFTANSDLSAEAFTPSTFSLDYLTADHLDLSYTSTSLELRVPSLTYTYDYKRYDNHVKPTALHLFEKNVVRGTPVRR